MAGRWAASTGDVHRRDRAAIAGSRLSETTDRAGSPITPRAGRHSQQTGETGKDDGQQRSHRFTPAEPYPLMSVDPSGLLL
jgi:hypothetical protein